MISASQYLKLGTSNKRREKKADHKRLRELYQQKWREIRDFRKVPAKEIENWQFNRIKELVSHAYKTVPLYREKYSKVGFLPEDLKSWQDFRSLPILTKEELIEGFPDRTVSKRFNFEFTTRSSGSSGKFATIAVSPEAIYLDTIQGARQFYFQSGGKYKTYDLALFIYTSPWWVASIDGNYRTEFLPTTTKPSEALGIIRRLKPKILSLYPTYLNKFYELKAPLKEFGIRLIVVHSEQSTSKQRRELSSYFGIPVLDEYSSEELTRIALECPFRKYHIEEDACYIEIVDPKTGENVEDGRYGSVIGTNLLNEAMPIIRYSQGDLASLEGFEKCACGSNFRVMDRIYGRYMDSIVTNKGETIPASCFMDLAYNWYLELDIPVHGLRYQIVQKEDGNICIYIISGVNGISQAQKFRIRESLYQLIPREMKVTVRVVKKLPVNTGVKFRPVISYKQKSE
ncbi:MAG: CapK protein [Microgenomates bacterium 39_6]|nr:MAG: CapK protein [Microgenomates bacterium 39_6]